MLYPLSYEGLRPISYLPGRSHACAGVPWASDQCRRVRWRGFPRWSEDARSKFRAFLVPVLVSSGQALAVPSGALGSRSNNGVDSTRVSCGSVAGASLWAAALEWRLWQSMTCHCRW
jgi:hypothetical protein